MKVIKLDTRVETYEIYDENECATIGTVELQYQGDKLVGIHVDCSGFPEAILEEDAIKTLFLIFKHFENVILRSYPELMKNEVVENLGVKKENRE